MFQNKPYIKKVAIMFLATILLITLFFVVRALGNRANITINATPGDSSIYIDGELLVGTNTKNVSKDVHTIRIYKEGYLEESRNVSVAKNITYTVSLTNNSFSKTQRASELGDLTIPTLTDNNLVAIDKVNNSLVILNKDLTKDRDIVLPGDFVPVSYSFGNGKILILGTKFIENTGETLSKYFVYGVVSGQLTELQLEEFEPITSLSLSPNNDGELIISAFYNATGNTCDIYRYNYKTKEKVLISKKIIGGLLLPLDKDRLLILRTQDEANGTTASVLNTTNRQTTQIIQKPDYVNQPTINTENTSIAYIGHKGLTVLDYVSGKKNYIFQNVPEKTLLAWLDKERVIVVNILKNSAFIVNTQTNSISEETELTPVPNKKIISVGKIGDQIVYYYKDNFSKQISVYKADITKP